ncbi:MAG: PspA/IM30 family protein [Planctomycetes bacterium]|nr:PspA/IM30 family protein [Planctomycetota bacterium]
MFSRIANLIRGFFSLFISGIEREHPEALLEAAQEDFRAKMAQARDALANSAGLVSKLQGQIRDQQSQITQITARITANVKAGNTAVAGELALRLSTLKADLARNQEQLKIAEQSYQTAVKQVSMAQTEFQKKMEQLKTKLNQAKINEALAAATSASANMSFKIGDLGDSLGRVDEILTDRVAKAEGKVRATGDLVAAQSVELGMKEEEQKALADQALAEFMASQGLSLPGAKVAEGAGAATDAPPADAGKQMGPAGFDAVSGK